jgi:hypothetical protein
MKLLALVEVEFAMQDQIHNLIFRAELVQHDDDLQRLNADDQKQGSGYH